MPVLKQGLDVITKMRTDANLRYIYNGPKKKGRGRPKAYGGKVDCSRIDKRSIKLFDEDEFVSYYSGIVYCMALKCLVRIVYIQEKKTGRYDILLSTDKQLDAALIVKYYRLRFQIEFLIRDAKQHTGLEDCQARSENKLHFHFNMAFSVVSIAKAATWLSIPKDLREAFSMRRSPCQVAEPSTLVPQEGLSQSRSLGFHPARTVRKVPAASGGRPGRVRQFAISYRSWP